MKQFKNNTLGYLLSTCNNQLIKLLNRELSNANLDLTREQYVVLNILWKKDYVNQQSIADELGKDKYSITKLIDGLEKRGLVKRIASKTDRRLKLIKVTQKSQRIRPLVNEVMQKTMDKAMADIPETNIEVAKNVLEKIICNINEK
jgi:DNA-binding MarR family transcriptional regulator